MKKVWESAQHTNLCIIYDLKEAWTPSNKEKLIESLGTATEFNCYSHLTVQECRGGGDGGRGMGLENPPSENRSLGLIFLGCCSSSPEMEAVHLFRVIWRINWKK